MATTNPNHSQLRPRPSPGSPRAVFIPLGWSSQVRSEACTVMETAHSTDAVFLLVGPYCCSWTAIKGQPVCVCGCGVQKGPG